MQRNGVWSDRDEMHPSPVLTAVRQRLLLPTISAAIVCISYSKKAPAWEDLAASVNGKGKGKINVAQVNCDDGGTDMCTRFGIETLPTLLYFHGGNYYMYKGLRSSEVLKRCALLIFFYFACPSSPRLLLLVCPIFPTLM